jgi:endoglucanase
MNDPTDAAWAQTMLDYLNGQAGALGGPTFGPGQKGIGTDWWAWGNLAGQLPEGTQNADGSLRSAQYDVYSKLR